MVSHTYHIHLESAIIQLPDVDDLLGKDVEVVIREMDPTDQASNFDTINQLLTNQASPDFFNQIEDPSAWQKQIRKYIMRFVDNLYVSNWLSIY